MTATLRPTTEDELAAMIREADGPLAITGGGTREARQARQGRRVEMAGLAGVTLYEPEALTLIARAGTPLAQITARLAAEGQMLGFEPDARPGATIGGVAAMNASGPRRVQVGAARDAMIGLRLVDGRGRVVKNGGRVMKNVTGYDLVKLVAGSRGRLGAITEISFKTMPIPPETAWLALAGLAPAQAVAALTAALGGPFDVSAALWRPGAGALLRIEGLAGSVAIRRAALAAHLRDFGPLTDAAPPGPLAEGARGAGAGGDVWRILCHPSEAGAILARLPAPLGLDWGGGLIWVAMAPGEAPDLPRFSGHARRLRDGAILPAPDPAIARIEAALAAQFDPRGLFGGA